MEEPIQLHTPDRPRRRSTKCSGCGRAEGAYHAAGCFVAAEESRSVGERRQDWLARMMAEAADREMLKAYPAWLVDERMMIPDAFLPSGRWTPTSRFMEGA